MIAVMRASGNTGGRISEQLLQHVTTLAFPADRLRLLRLMFGSRAQLAAENLFLRKQLACDIERQVRPRRTDDASRMTLVLLSRFVD